VPKEPRRPAALTNKIFLVTVGQMRNGFAAIMSTAMLM
jgi:hypothetical protein